MIGSELRSDRSGRALRAATLGLGLVLAAAVAGAHQLSADDVIARLRAPAAREAYDVVDVERHPGLPRMLLVRVGERWRTLPAERRREAAEDWLRAWRHAVAQGVVSILDVQTGRAVVNFDARGNALVRP
ncbi:MAG TPA: hypothetical protein VIS07_19040 [Candidatus Binatia bacterium]